MDREMRVALLRSILEKLVAGMKVADPDGISVMHKWDMQICISIMQHINDWFH